MRHWEHGHGNFAFSGPPYLVIWYWSVLNFTRGCLPESTHLHTYGTMPPTCVYCYPCIYKYRCTIPCARARKHRFVHPASVYTYTIYSFEFVNASCLQYVHTGFCIEFVNESCLQYVHTGFCIEFVNAWCVVSCSVSLFVLVFVFCLFLVSVLS